VNQRWWTFIEKSPGGLCSRSALSVNVKLRSYLNTTSADLAPTTLNASNIMNNKFEGEQEDYLVSYYDKDGLLHHVAEFGNEEHAKYCTKSQQKHFEGVELFVVKRTFILEVV
jgi:hypothetical protein